MKLIDNYKEQLAEVCEQYCVDELFLFGSALTPDFTPSSDMDFLVKFGGVSLMDYYDNYYDFRSSLEQLFDRKVDLVEIQTLKNPILKRSIDQSKTLIYERKDTQIPV